MQSFSGSFLNLNLLIGAGYGTTSSSIQSAEEQLLQRWRSRRTVVELSKRRRRWRRWWIGWRHTDQSHSAGFAAQRRQQLCVGQGQLSFGRIVAARPLLAGGRFRQRRRPHFTRHSGPGSKSRLHYSSQGDWIHQYLLTSFRIDPDGPCCIQDPFCNGSRRFAYFIKSDDL